MKQYKIKNQFFIVTLTHAYEKIKEAARDSRSINAESANTVSLFLNECLWEV